jgi:hypothetical protein
MTLSLTALKRPLSLLSLSLFAQRICSEKCECFFFSFGVTTPFFDLGCYIETLNITVCLSRQICARKKRQRKESE